MPCVLFCSDIQKQTVFRLRIDPKALRSCWTPQKVISMLQALSGTFTSPASTLLFRRLGSQLKTEFEKMVAGEFYDANHPELLDMREEAVVLCSEYNKTTNKETEKRADILKKLFKSDTIPYIQPPFHCDYGFNIKLGKDVYMNFGATILDGCEVKIGDKTMLGPNVQVYTASHPIDPVLRNSGLEFGRPITIGESCWIGGNTTIVPGVTIGNNCVIGSGSVVTKDIPDNSIAVGNPARVIKKIDISKSKSN